MLQVLAAREKQKQIQSANGHRLRKTEPNEENREKSAKVAVTLSYFSFSEPWDLHSDDLLSASPRGMWKEDSQRPDHRTEEEAVKKIRRCE